MVRNNYNEPNKATFVDWVDEALGMALCKGNIKNGFQVTKIWPLNPKVIDGRTKPIKLYTVDYNNNTSDEDNVKKSNGAVNDTKGWGENGATTKLVNIATIINELVIIRTDVDGHEQLLGYYVEEPTSLGNLEDTSTKGYLDYIVNLFQPTHVTEKELVHFRRARAPLCLQNLLSLSHMPPRKTSGKESLMDYS
jgi:hypothetical protein